MSPPPMSAWMTAPCKSQIRRFHLRENVVHDAMQPFNHRHYSNTSRNEWLCHGFCFTFPCKATIVQQNLENENNRYICQIWEICNKAVSVDLIMDVRNWSTVSDIFDCNSVITGCNSSIHINSSIHKLTHFEFKKKRTAWICITRNCFVHVAFA